MRKLLVVAVIIVILLMILAVVHTVPTSTTKLKRIATIFLGILAGVAAIAEGVGLFNHFRIATSKNSKADVSSTEGDYSPAEVGGSYIVRRKRKSKKRDRSPRVSSPTQRSDDTIRTEGGHIRTTRGHYSPAKVGENYEVDDG